MSAIYKMRPSEYADAIKEGTMFCSVCRRVESLDSQCPSCGRQGSSVQESVFAGEISVC